MLQHELPRFISFFLTASADLRLRPVVIDLAVMKLESLHLIALSRTKPRVACPGIPLWCAVRAIYRFSHFCLRELRALWHSSTMGKIRSGCEGGSGRRRKRLYVARFVVNAHFARHDYFRNEFSRSLELFQFSCRADVPCFRPPTRGVYEAWP